MTTASYPRRRRYTSADVDCPACGAERGTRCCGSRNQVVDYHFDRRQAAAALNHAAAGEN